MTTYNLGYCLHPSLRVSVPHGCGGAAGIGWRDENCCRPIAVTGDPLLAVGDLDDVDSAVGWLTI